MKEVQLLENLTGKKVFLKEGRHNNILNANYDKLMSTVLESIKTLLVLQERAIYESAIESGKTQRSDFDEKEAISTMINEIKAAKTLTDLDTVINNNFGSSLWERLT